MNDIDSAILRSVEAQLVERINCQTVSLTVSPCDLTALHCVQCKDSVRSIIRRDFSDQGIFLLNADSFLCYDCWIDIGMKMGDWQSSLEHEVREKKERDVEERMTPEQMYEKRERKKVTARFAVRPTKCQRSASRRAEADRWSREMLRVSDLSGSSRMIYEMDGYTCVYCGVQKDLLIEHIRPLSRGGVTSECNCVTACRLCNAEKGNKTAVEANMILAYGRFNEVIYGR